MVSLHENAGEQQHPGGRLSDLVVCSSAFSPIRPTVFRIERPDTAALPG